MKLRFWLQLLVMMALQKTRMSGNTRGFRWFSIFGYDQNNKKVSSSLTKSKKLTNLKQEPSLASWHRRNHQSAEHFFRKGAAPYIIK